MNLPINDHRRQRLDAAAIVLSSVCMLHCLALPIVLTILPIANVSLVEEATFHLLMMTLILPISLIALTIGCRQHKDRLTLVLGTVGLVVLTATAVFGHVWFGFLGERIVTSLGGLILASAHIQNFRCCRANDCTHEH